MERDAMIKEKRLNIMKWAILSKLVVRSSATFIKVHKFFEDIDKRIL